MSPHATSPPERVVDDDTTVTIDRDQTPDRWRYTCPHGHTDWDRTNHHIWCVACRRLSESGTDVDPEHYELLDKQRNELIPFEQVTLK